MAETTAATWLTQEAYDRLKAEYEHLTGPGRTEIATRIAQARDEGDLKENSGYHAAREEQAKQEARIREPQGKPERPDRHPAGRRRRRAGHARPRRGRW